MSHDRPQVDDYIQEMYQPGAVLGRGSYGVVLRGSRERRDGTRKPIALKKCLAVFRNPHDALRTAREVLLLRQLSHPNIVSLLCTHRAAGDQHFYLVFELCDSSLRSIILPTPVYSADHLKYMAWQLILAVHYLHNRGVVHRDIKPANILVDLKKTVLKLADFGEARAMMEGAGLGQGDRDQDMSNQMTQDNATLWYKAPEMLVRSPTYSIPVDCWSSGCVFAELVLYSPAFRGHDVVEQLRVVLAGAGVPGGSEDIDALESPYSTTMLRHVCLRQSGLIFEKMQRSALAAPDLLNLIQRFLTVNPRKRVTMGEALRDPYFEGYRPADLERAFSTTHGIVEWDLGPLAENTAAHYRAQLYRKCRLDTSDEASTPRRGRTPGQSPRASELSHSPSDHPMETAAGGDPRAPLLDRRSSASGSVAGRKASPQQQQQQPAAEPPAQQPKKCCTIL